jgi:glutathione S-transferase
MLELYHTANSVCAQKVRIQLAEKGLAWSSRLLTLRGDQFAPAYLKLNPNAVVPTLVHDGFPVIESSVILYYLEECYPEPSMMPASPRARMKVRLFNKLIDESVHNACTILTFATALRSRFRNMIPSDREAYLSNAPSQQRAAYKRDVIERGLESRFVADAIAQYEKLLEWVDQAAGQSDYLAGAEFSIADAAVIPYLMRLDLLKLSKIWRNRPHVQTWYDRVRSRPSVESGILGGMTGADMALFKNMDFDPWPSVAAVLAQNRT